MYVSASLLLVAGSVFGQVQPILEQPQPPTISVRGQAEVTAPPNQVVIRAGAVIQQPQADAAQAQVNQIMQRAIRAITALGISASQIQTAGITLAPVYTTIPPPGTTQNLLEPRIIAYRASNAVQVRLDNLELLGQVIDAAVAAGANQIEDMAFQIRDDSEYRQEALSTAARQARAKAQAIAQALGVRIIGVQQVQEAGVETIRPMAYARQATALTEAGTAPTPVQPGQVRVQANVIVSYQISGSPRPAGNEGLGEGGPRRQGATTGTAD